MDLAGAAQILAGTLTPQTYPGPTGIDGDPDGTPLVPDSFNLPSVGPFRYLRFDALSMGAAADKSGGAVGVGLNEIRVCVPEPTCLSLLLLIPLDSVIEQSCAAKKPPLRRDGTGLNLATEVLANSTV